MGIKYSLFRLLYGINKKTGYLLKRFPAKASSYFFFSSDEWKKKDISIFELITDQYLPNEKEKDDLKALYDKIIRGEIKFFGYKYFFLGKDYDWITNPLTGYRYNIDEHWSKIRDIDHLAGDIKFVWEKARFSYLLAIMRYDRYFDTDNSEFIFNEIIDFIKHNPINKGPNYICSQEISIRTLNWLILLQYYKDSKHLNEALLNKILNHIYMQTKHVYDNINFSRYSVRNNHVIVEASLLIIIGKLFPEFNDANAWFKKGLKLFSKEIDYQIYPDGTYLQFSHNYHRLIVQILTFVISFANHHDIELPVKIYDKAYLSLKFLYRCQYPESGKLPNYGANDGALIFPLNGNDFRDYRPQMDALHKLLTSKDLYNEIFEDRSWFPLRENEYLSYDPLKEVQGISCFKDGGIYIIRENETITTLVNTKYKDRPGHADALHLDIWHKGENILPDAGSFSYNANEDMIRYFNGSSSHNTIMVENKDHMLKGNRFIWYYWIRNNSVETMEDNEKFTVIAITHAYRYLKKDIRLKRTLIKYKDINKWEVIDEIIAKPPHSKIVQNWHYTLNGPIFKSDGMSDTGQSLISDYYGISENCSRITFSSDSNTINTTITI